MYTFGGSGGGISQVQLQEELTIQYISTFILCWWVVHNAWGEELFLTVKIFVEYQMVFLSSIRLNCRGFPLGIIIMWSADNRQCVCVWATNVLSALSLRPLCGLGWGMVEVCRLGNAWVAVYTQCRMWSVVWVGNLIIPGNVILSAPCVHYAVFTHRPNP